MTTQKVFCPNCGIQSDPGTRFCKRCGTNLEAVSRALTGQLSSESDEATLAEMEVAFTQDLTRAISHLGISLVTFATFLFWFRGAFWVYFILFWTVSAIGEVVQAAIARNRLSNPVAYRASLEEYKKLKGGKKRRRRRDKETDHEPAYLPPPVQSAGYPLANEPEFVVRNTGELERPHELEFDPERPPASVTEGTTRLLDDEEPSSSSPGERAPVRERQ